MKLHLDVNAFRVLLDTIHSRTGYRTDVLEKDYYVVLILKELAEKQQQGLPAYFKGGTALYKALKTTNRFSEDIDLSVDTRGCSNAQNKKRLEDATKKYHSLERNVDEGTTNRSVIISVYNYHPITAFDKDDELQRFGKLKIEATSFTISEPTTSLEITPLIYEQATAEEQRVLREQYDVAPINVLTITVERIFIDKLFAAEAYVRASSNPHRAFESAKHIYDLSVMMKQTNIQALFADEKSMQQLLDIRMQEERSRKDGISGVLPKEFMFFDAIQTNEAVEKAYQTMQKQYVLRPEDRIPFETAFTSMQQIKSNLLKCKAWAEYEALI